MRSVNKVILIGNLTRDPSVRQTPSGQMVASFGVATNRQWITKENDKQASTEFHELVAWAKLAELAEKHLRKGKLVYVEGYLSTRSWETPEGIKKFKTEIVVQDMIMLNKRGEYTKKAETRETAVTSVAAKPAASEALEKKETEAAPPTELPEEKQEAVEEQPVAAISSDLEEKPQDNIIDKDLGL